MNGATTQHNRVPYRPTQLERAHASHLLVTYFNTPVDTDDNAEMRVSGRDAVPFLTTSGVERSLLRLIWSVADPESVGTLTVRSQFHTLLRLIAMAQAHFLPPLPSAPESGPQYINQLNDALVQNAHLIIAIPTFNAETNPPSVAYLLGTYPSPPPAPTPISYNFGKSGSMETGTSGGGLQNSHAATGNDGADVDISRMLTNHDLQHQMWQKYQQQRQSEGDSMGSSIATVSVTRLSVSDAFGGLNEVEDRPLPSLQPPPPPPPPQNTPMYREDKNVENMKVTTSLEMISQECQENVTNGEGNDDFGDFDRVSIKNTKEDAIKMKKSDDLGGFEDSDVMPSSVVTTFGNNDRKSMAENILTITNDTDKSAGAVDRFPNGAIPFPSAFGMSGSMLTASDTLGSMVVEQGPFQPYESTTTANVNGTGEDDKQEGAIKPETCLSDEEGVNFETKKSNHIGGYENGFPIGNANGTPLPPRRNLSPNDINEGVAINHEFRINESGSFRNDEEKMQYSGTIPASSRAFQSTYTSEGHFRDFEGSYNANNFRQSKTKSSTAFHEVGDFRDSSSPPLGELSTQNSLETSENNNIRHAEGVRHWNSLIQKGTDVNEFDEDCDDEFGDFEGIQVNNTTPPHIEDGTIVAQNVSVDFEARGDIQNEFFPPPFASSNRNENLQQSSKTGDDFEDFGGTKSNDALDDVMNNTYKISAMTDAFDVFGGIQDAPLPPLGDLSSLGNPVVSKSIKQSDEFGDFDDTNDIAASSKSLNDDNAFSQNASSAFAECGEIEDASLPYLDRLSVSNKQNKKEPDEIDNALGGIQNVQMPRLGNFSATHEQNASDYGFDDDFGDFEGVRNEEEAPATVNDVNAVSLDASPPFDAFGDIQDVSLPPHDGLAGFDAQNATKPDEIEDDFGDFKGTSNNDAAPDSINDIGNFVSVEAPSAFEDDQDAQLPPLSGSSATKEQQATEHDEFEADFGDFKGVKNDEAAPNSVNETNKASMDASSSFMAFSDVKDSPLPPFKSVPATDNQNSTEPTAFDSVNGTNVVSTDALSAFDSFVDAQTAPLPRLGGSSTSNGQFEVTNNVEAIPSSVNDGKVVLPNASSAFDAFGDIQDAPLPPLGGLFASKQQQETQSDAFNDDFEFFEGTKNDHLGTDTVDDMNAVSLESSSAFATFGYAQGAHILPLDGSSASNEQEATEDDEFEDDFGDFVDTNEDVTAPDCVNGTNFVSEDASSAFDEVGGIQDASPPPIGSLSASKQQKETQSDAFDDDYGDFEGTKNGNASNDTDEDLNAASVDASYALATFGDTQGAPLPPLGDSYATKEQQATESDEFEGDCGDFEGTNIVVAAPDSVNGTNDVSEDASSAFDTFVSIKNAPLLPLGSLSVSNVNQAVESDAFDDDSGDFEGSKNQHSDPDTGNDLNLASVDASYVFATFDDGQGEPLPPLVSSSASNDQQATKPDEIKDKFGDFEGTNDANANPNTLNDTNAVSSEALSAFVAFGDIQDAPLPPLGGLSTSNEQHGAEPEKNDVNFGDFKDTDVTAIGKARDNVAIEHIEASCPILNDTQNGCPDLGGVSVPIASIGNQNEGIIPQHNGSNFDYSESEKFNEDQGLEIEAPSDEKATNANYLITKLDKDDDEFGVFNSTNNHGNSIDLYGDPLPISSEVLLSSNEEDDFAEFKGVDGIGAAEASIDGHSLAAQDAPIFDAFGNAQECKSEALSYSTLTTPDNENNDKNSGRGEVVVNGEGSVGYDAALISEHKRVEISAAPGDFEEFGDFSGFPSSADDFSKDNNSINEVYHTPRNEKDCTSRNDAEGFGEFSAFGSYFNPSDSGVKDADGHEDDWAGFEGSEQEHDDSTNTLEIFSILRKKLCNLKSLPEITQNGGDCNVPILECFDKCVSRKSESMENRRLQLERCIFLSEMMTIDNNIIYQRWKVVISNVNDDLQIGTKVLTYLAANSEKEDSKMMLQSRKLHNYVLGLSECVRLVRFIAATIGDLLCIDIGFELKSGTLANWYNHPLVAKAQVIEDLWAGLSSIAANVGLLSTQHELEKIPDIRARVVSCASASSNQVFCHLTLQPLNISANDSVNTEYVSSADKFYITCAARYWINRLQNKL